MSEILVLPKPDQEKKKRKRKPALTSKGLCITDNEVLEQLKAEASEKQTKAEEVAERKQEREQKKKKKIKLFVYRLELPNKKYTLKHLFSFLICSHSDSY